MMDFTENPRLDVFKSELIKGADLSSKYEFPILERVHIARRDCSGKHERLYTRQAGPLLF